MADITMDASTPRLVRSGGVEWARTVLRADALLCAGSGALLLVGASPLARLADGEPVGVVRGIGAFLLLFAADLVLLSRVRAERVGTAVAVAGACSVAWIAATVGVIAAGWLDPGGVVLALAGAVVVSGFAWQELASAVDIRRAPRLVRRVGR
jgi:hypothetical protein